MWNNENDRTTPLRNSPVSVKLFYKEISHVTIVTKEQDNSSET